MGVEFRHLAVSRTWVVGGVMCGNGNMFSDPEGLKAEIFGLTSNLSWISRLLRQKHRYANLHRRCPPQICLWKYASFQRDCKPAPTLLSNNRGRRPTVLRTGLSKHQMFSYSRGEAARRGPHDSLPQRWFLVGRRRRPVWYRPPGADGN